jgi:predicted nuclease with TOPRIM domain
MLQKAKEKLHKKIHELERGLDAKQALELEIEQLRGAMQVMNRIGETDLEEKKKLEAIKMDLQEKEEELEGVEDLQQTLVIQERKTNDELQDARKKLIYVCIFLNIYNIIMLICLFAINSSYSLNINFRMSSVTNILQNHDGFFICINYFVKLKQKCKVIYIS